MAASSATAHDLIRAARGQAAAPARRIKSVNFSSQVVLSFQLYFFHLGSDHH